MILGTAGHIDHGKTALVRALTGVDTDRLPEERRRGITIELGFAPLTLALDGAGAGAASALTIGVVDVPGHEDFVRTMLAGASGIDAALLVVAADEGVMPQTREHLAILELLGIRAGVVALTKADLVDAEWLALVQEDVERLLAGTALAGSRQIPVSSATGTGLDALRAAIAELAAGARPRHEADLFRLPIDRAFTVKGTGTVVTGTVWTGRLRRDETVRILPGGITARVRSLQSHGAAIDAAGPGIRAAVGLSGVDVAAVPRGSTLVTQGSWEPTTLVRADVVLLPDAPPIGPRAHVRFHLGTREVEARIIARGGVVRPPVGAALPLQRAPRTPVRIVLQEPIVARGGDRFVLRTGSPAATIGGGVVTDAAPGHRRAKPWPQPGGTASERLVRLTADSGLRGLSEASAAIRAGLQPAQITEAANAAADRIEMLQGVLYDRAALAALAERMTETVDLHHQRAPLEDGLSIQALRALAGGSPIVDRMLQRLVAAGRLLVARGLASRPGWAVRPSPVQESAMERLAAAIRGAGREPPSTSELATSGMVGVSDPDEIATLLRVLERRGIVRQVELDRYYSIEALDGLRTALRTGMSPGREYGPAELRDLLGVSRKYLIPLLEHCDRVGLTERRTGGRVRADGRPAPRGPKGAEEIPDEAASSPAEAAGTE